MSTEECQEAQKYRNDKMARLMLEQMDAMGRMQAQVLRKEGAAEEEIAAFEARIQDQITVRAGCMLLKGLLQA